MAERISYIDNPNLKTARTVTFIAAGTQLFLSQLFTVFIGAEWISKLSMTYLIVTLIQLWAYYLFTEYLRNFNLLRLIVIIYVIMGFQALQAITPILISYMAPNGMYYAISIVYSGISILNIATIALLYIAGISLIRFRNDSIGGLSLVGKLFTVKATLIALNIIYYLYYYLQFYISSDNIGSFNTMSPSITSTVNTLTVILNIAILVYMISIYNKAEKHNETAISEEENSIMDDIDNIGVN